MNTGLLAETADPCPCQSWILGGLGILLPNLGNICVCVWTFQVVYC